MNKLPIGASGIIKVTQQDNGNFVIDIDPTYRGQVSINTVGTIKEGDWEGNIISPQFGGTGCNNNDAYLRLGGETIITNSIVIECDNNTKVSIPESGTMAITQNSLQINNELEEIKHSIKAYNNISPNKYNGDITYHDGENNDRLAIGNENDYLTVSNGLPKWSEFPNYVRYIFHNSNSLIERPAINFIGASFQIEDGFYFTIGYQDKFGKNLFCATGIKLHDNLEQLAQTNKPGFLVAGSNEPRILVQGNGIDIKNPNGFDKEGNLNNPIIGIDENYRGQNSINTLGTVTNGKWNADTIAPEFGGTGNVNKHKIKLGGNFKTNCHVYIEAPENTKAEIFLYSKGTVFLDLPDEGTLSTVQKSLQCQNNLHDVHDPIEAFRHISPTKNRGDIIVKGYGDYDIKLPIGEEGQVLTVNKQKPGYLEWQDLNIKEISAQVTNEILLEKEKIAEEKNKASKHLKNSTDSLDIEKCVHAIMMQLDHMSRSNQLRPLKELQEILQLWSQSLLK